MRVAVTRTDVARPLPARDAAEVFVGRRSRYRVVKPLSRGGTARLFLAADENTGQVVVIKQALGSQESLRLWSEFKALQRAPFGFARLIDSGPDCAFLVLERLIGRSLAEAMADKGSFEPARAREIALRIAEILRRMHLDLGVAHRDLHPGNVLLADYLDGGFDVWLLDLGSAAEIGQPSLLTGVGRICGAPGWIPFEKEFGPVSVAPTEDVWGWGALLLYMLCGNDCSPRARGTDDEEARIASLIEAAPAAMRPVLSRALGRDPRERPASMSECQRMLEDGSRDEAITKRARRARSRRSSDNVIAWTAAAILCVTALGVWTHHEVGRSSEIGARETKVEALMNDIGRRVKGVRRALAEVEQKVGLNEKATRQIDGVLGERASTAAPGATERGP